MDRHAERASPGSSTVGVGLQVEDQRESLVDSFHLLDGQPAGWLCEAVEIDGRELVAHHQCLLISNDHRRPEDRLTSAGTRERDDPGAESEPVWLQDDGVPPTFLRVTFAARGQPIDLTPHAVQRCRPEWLGLQQGRPDHP